MTKSDIMKAEDIFRHNLVSLKGNNVCRSGTTVAYRKKIIPTQIMEKYIEVAGRMNIFF